MKTTLNYKTSTGRRHRLNMVRTMLSEMQSAEKGLETVSYLSERETLDIIIDAVHKDLVDANNKAEETAPEVTDGE